MCDTLDTSLTNCHTLSTAYFTYSLPLLSRLEQIPFMPFVTIHANIQSLIKLLLRIGKDSPFCFDAFKMTEEKERFLCAWFVY